MLKRSMRAASVAAMFLAAAALVAVTPSAPAIAAATITVNTTQQGVTDADHCSLQEAIYSAEFGSNIAINATDPDTTYTTGCAPGTGNGDTIELPGGTLSFSALWDGDAHNPFGPTATPIIFKSITIEGHGTTLEPSAGAGNFRLFAVGHASFAVDGTTYSGDGSLTLNDVRIHGFHAKGGNGASGGGGGLGAGGAIYLGTLPGAASPSLTVENSTFDGNGAVGGNGGGPGEAGGGGGLGGNGGIDDQSQYGAIGGGGGGARGNGGPGTNGGGGGGGTVYDGLSAPAGGSGGYLCGGAGGGEGNDGVTPDNCPGGGGGGGGLCAFCGPGGTITETGNGGNGTYGGGGGGGAGNGGDGGFGGGAGAGASCANHPCGGQAGFGGGGSSDRSAVAFGGTGHGGAGGGGGALGGAIFNDGGTVVVQNSTFNADYVTRGLGGGGTPPADDGGDSGGAIYSRNGSLTVQNATVSGNEATGAGGGIVVNQGGASTTFVLDNTIIANNGSQGCIVAGTVTTTGSAANLILDNSGCPAMTVTSDPQLGPLQLNAPGDTPTMAIQVDVSPAVDAGDDGTALSTDQRGVSRPQGAHSDIGAYEAPPPSADVSLTKDVSGAAALPGDTVEYTLTLHNAGPNAAKDVVVTDALPSQVTFVSCAATGGGSCTSSASGITASYGSLAVDETETVTIDATLNFGVADGSTVGNTASVTSSTPDPDTSNNSGSASFTAQNNSDLFLTESAAKLKNRQLRYSVAVKNLGKYLAKQLVLTDAVPKGAVFVSISAGSWSCSAPPAGSTGTISCSLSTLAVNTTQSITFVVKVTAPASVLITNTASVTVATFDPNTANNTATLTSKVGS